MFMFPYSLPFLDAGGDFPHNLYPHNFTPQRQRTRFVPAYIMKYLGLSDPSLHRLHHPGLYENEVATNWRPVVVFWVQMSLNQHGTPKASL